MVGIVQSWLPSKRLGIRGIPFTTKHPSENVMPVALHSLRDLAGACVLIRVSQNNWIAC